MQGILQLRGIGSCPQNEAEVHSYRRVDEQNDREQPTGED